MPALVTNNATSTLASGISAVVTTLSVAAGEGARFPSLSGNNYFYCTLAGVNGIEVVKVTARATDAFTIVRAQDSTTAKVYSTGETVELRPVAALFSADALLPDQTSNSGKLLTTNGTVCSWGVLTTTGTGSTYVLSVSPTLTGTVVAAAATLSGLLTLSSATPLTLTGTAARITGDFTHATLASRAHFQTTTANNMTSVGAIPNGSGTAAQWVSYAGSDPDNTHYLLSGVSTSTAFINTGKNGTGTVRAMELQISSTTMFGIETDGRLYGTAMHNTGTVTGTSKQYIASGTYTPTYANVVNTSAGTPRSTHWFRVGNVVHVAGSTSLTVTAGAPTNTSFSLTLPIASTLAGQQNLVGGGFWEGGVPADIVNNLKANSNIALVAFRATTPGTADCYFYFTYLVA